LIIERMLSRLVATKRNVSNPYIEREEKRIHSNP